MDHEFPHIRYLSVVREIYRHGRISAAAEIVHMSQPAATNALAKLEKTLGVSLFDRTPKGIFPTEAGHIFKPRVERVLEFLSRGDANARAKATRRDGKARKSTFYNLCTPVQLRSLVAVAKAGSVSQAAYELGVSQPGVHRAVRELGSIANIELFEQTRGGVVLTPAAKALTHQVRLALSEFRQAIFEMNEHLGQEVTRINLGSMPLSRTSIIPAAIDRMIQVAGASIQINCVDARYPLLLRDLRFGELDLLIGALRHPKPSQAIEQVKLFQDHLAIVASSTHPLAQKDHVTLEDTLNYPWVAPPKDTPSGSYLYETLGIGGMENTPVRIVSSSLILLRGLLARGEYLSIASKRQIEVDLELGTMVTLPIDLPGSGRPIGLTMRTDWKPTPMQKRFVDLLSQESSQNENSPP